MNYVKFDAQGNVIGLVNGFPEELKNGPWNPAWQNRNDWDSFEQVTEIAAKVSAFTKETYLPTDAGEYTSPRYDFVRAPKVGDEVSYGFNGDTYPDGVIVKVNANLRFVWTSNGNKYIRKGQTGGWKRNGTWWLVPGHVYTQNPHF